MKTQKKKLDKIDLQILNQLQLNGRISNVELANLVNISPPSCLRRVKALEDTNFIKGYNAEINADNHLVCPRHGWKFDLNKNGIDKKSKTTINSKKII